MRIIAKSGLEGDAWIDGYDYPNKDKNISLRPFFYAHSKTQVISHSVITAILDTILTISTF